MNTEELISRLRTILTVEVPAGTLRRWAYEGLIPHSQSTGHAGKRGRFVSWPAETVEQASAVYVLRHAKIPWAKTDKKTLLAAKEVVYRFYAIIQKFRETEDPDLLFGFGKLLAPVASPLFVPKGMRGHMYGGVTLNPLVVTWIATLEKIRHARAVYTHLEVIFNWNHHIMRENGEERRKLKYDGVTFASSQSDIVGWKVGYTPEALERQLGRKPVNWEEGERKFEVIKINKDTELVDVDARRQILIIRDPKTKQLIKLQFGGR